MMKSPSTVLYLNHGAKLGGGEIALLRMLGALDRALYEPVVVFGEEGPAARQARDSGIETVILPLAGAVRELRKDSVRSGALFDLSRVGAVLSYSAKVARLAREKRAHLIHTNTVKAHIYGAMAARLTRLPLAWHVRDFVNESYFPPFAVRTLRWLARFLPKRIIAVSRSVLEQLRLPVNDARGTVIHDGLADEHFRVASEPLRQPAAGAPLRVGMVGRMAEWKGQHVFLKAAASVLKSGAHVEFVVAGAPLFGEVAYEESLRRQVEQLGIGDHVSFTGFIHDVPSLLGSLDILVHASITDEPFGQVITEGMAAGKAVIASRGGGVPEIITHDRSGILTPMGDSEAIARELLSLIHDPARRERIARAGNDRAREHFTASRTARRVEQLYGELLDRTPPGQRASTSA